MLSALWNTSERPWKEDEHGRRLNSLSRKLPAAPDEDDVARLLSLARGWLRLVVALAVYAGLRSGELRALEARDMDLKNNVIHVRRAFSHDDVLTPKSGDERTVPIAEPLRPFLVEALRCKVGAARLVVNLLGRTPRRPHVLAALRKLQNRHSLPLWSVHQLRHAFCSVLVRRGASLEAVRLLAGHEDLETTQRYVHAHAADLRTAIGMFAGNSWETGTSSKS